MQACHARNRCFTETFNEKGSRVRVGIDLGEGLKRDVTRMNGVFTCHFAISRRYQGIHEDDNGNFRVFYWKLDCDNILTRYYIIGRIAKRLSDVLRILCKSFIFSTFYFFSDFYCLLHYIRTDNTVITVHQNSYLMLLKSTCHIFQKQEFIV